MYLGCIVEQFQCARLPILKLLSTDFLGRFWNIVIFKSRLSLIVRVNVVLNRTVVVDSD